MSLRVDEHRIALSSVSAFALATPVGRGEVLEVTLGDGCRERVEASHAVLTRLLEQRVAIYGVTTGFGDSNRQTIDASQSEALQRNLVSYLLCGTGAPMPRPAVRAMCVARLVSLTRGHSGVSWDLIRQLQAVIEYDLMPIVPCEGSLGASGDLVPLAYLAEVVQGQGRVSTPKGEMATADVFRELKIKPYVLKPKEGLALVNGTSSMTGMALYNHARLNELVDLAQLGTAMLCLAVQGRADAFGELVNEKAKRHKGQARAARRIRELLKAEGYVSPALLSGGTSGGVLVRPVQDRYSLRCSPQILGPVLDTLEMFGGWLEDELNSVSDNPLFDSSDESMANGGNFYGGYLGHGMDYFKICTAHVVDMLDRQVMLLFDPGAGYGFPPNLANWPAMTAEERHLHHGLKGLHQATSAITSEVIAMTTASTVFSRSSESHNQDKVSLGMSAATAFSAMLDKAFTVSALSLSCVAQALDLKRVSLKGEEARCLKELIRRHVPFVEKDQALGQEVTQLKLALENRAMARGL